ncbi:MAG: hypothetical protein Q9M28_07670 [Mariprofundaceae bacterium]|nr:hypothetical protein [Mariprofundaceae bacterium]
MSEHLFDNAGRTKLALVTYGVTLPDGLPQPSHWLSQSNTMETVIDMRLPTGHWVSVPVGQPYHQESDLSLHVSKTRAWLVCEQRELDVELIRSPSFYSQRTRTGARMGSFSSLHDRVLVLQPLMGCGFFSGEKKACQYCVFDSMLNEATPPLRNHLDLVEVVLEALKERDLDTVYLYNAYTPGDDVGLGRLLPIISLIRRHIGHRQIALETVAPKDLAVIDELYAAGLDIFICNMEIYDESCFANVCPGKHQLGGHQVIMAALRHALSIFRHGAVVSNLIIGLEPVESTCVGIETLVGEGVVPLLVPFRPLPNTSLMQHHVPNLETVEQAFLHLYRCLLLSKLPTYRLRDMGRVFTPMESRVLIGGTVTLDQHLAKIVTSEVGRKLYGWIDKLRRQLRVRYEDD